MIRLTDVKGFIQVENLLACTERTAIKPCRRSLLPQLSSICRVLHAIAAGSVKSRRVLHRPNSNPTPIALHNALLLGETRRLVNIDINIVRHLVWLRRLCRVVRCGVGITRDRVNTMDVLHEGGVWQNADKSVQGK